VTAPRPPSSEVKVSDLTPFMQRRLLEAYERRTRRRCSQEDFSDGYLAALIDLGSRSSFRAVPEETPDASV
jgi:hypothetical protein